MASRTLDLSLTEPQAAFALSTAKFPCVVAGFGSGKTKALVDRLGMQKLMFPRQVVAYYAPTYDLVMRVGWARIQELLDTHRIPYKTNKNEKIIKVKGSGEFLFRTMENPAALVGYEHGHAGVDELDTLKPVHAQEAWRKILSRNRQKLPNKATNTIAVATTPEGFRFVYEKWHKAPEEGYVLYRASTYSNLHNLPSDYIQNLEKDYPPNLLAAYVNGQFVNLTRGSVYPVFDRDLNRSTAKPNAGEQLHIGMDFNVNKMSAAVNVIREGRPVAVGEFWKVADTPSMIEAIKTRYGNEHRSITIYPDAAGNATSSKSASISDILLLRQAGFAVDAPSANPKIKDRVAAVNGIILNAAGQRRFTINVDACPNLAECLEQQVYDETTAAPDKKAGKDHLPDALGYFIHRRWPVGRDQPQVLRVSAY